jgi:hypothetical protein
LAEILCGIIDGIGPTYIPSIRDDYKYLGLRYAAVPFDWEANWPDYFVSIKQHQSGIDKTPEDAIAGFLKK